MNLLKETFTEQIAGYGRVFHTVGQQLLLTDDFPGDIFNME